MARVIANHLGQMKRDVVQFSELLEKMYATSSQAFNELDSLTGMWEGSANEAFRTQFMEDAQYMDSLYSFLKKYSGELKKDHQRYAGCEAEIESLIREIHV